MERSGASVGFFTEVSGLGSETDIVEYRDGSDPDVERVVKLPGPLRTHNLTLKRGIISSTDLWEWRKQVEEGDFEGARSPVSVIVYDETMALVAQWDLTDAWPVSINFDSEGNLESLVIAYADYFRLE